MLTLTLTQNTMLSKLLLFLVFSFLCFNFAHTGNTFTKFTKIEIVESLTNSKNPVFDDKLEVPFFTFSKKEVAESYLAMLNNIVKFEKSLKILLKALLPTAKALGASNILSFKDFQDNSELGVEVYKFEKELKAISLKSISNSEKRGSVVNQLKEKVSKTEFFWKCNKHTDNISVKNSDLSSLLCLLMVYKLKMAIVQAHPDIPEVLWQPNGLGGNPERLDALDLERIFIVQNLGRELKHIIVESDIIDLEKAQGYDTLVIPSNIYQSSDSMQKFKQLRKNFWHENKMENYVKCFGHRNEESSYRDRAALPPLRALKNLFNSLYSCLKFLDKVELTDKKDSSCTKEFMSYLEKNKGNTLNKLEKCSLNLNIHLLTNRARLVQLSLLSWVFIMEWVTTKRMTEENNLKLGVNSWEFKFEYEHFLPSTSTQVKEKNSNSRGRKRNLEILTPNLTEAKEKRINTSHKASPSKTHKNTIITTLDSLPSDGFSRINSLSRIPDNPYVDPYNTILSETSGSYFQKEDQTGTSTIDASFKSTQNSDHMGANSEIFDTSDQQRHTSTDPSVTSDHFATQPFPTAFQEIGPYLQENEFLDSSVTHLNTIISPSNSLLTEDLSQMDSPSRIQDAPNVNHNSDEFWLRSFVEEPLEYPQNFRDIEYSNTNDNGIHLNISLSYDY
ncbi:hypothetical protein HMI54_014959 [Coelomomyces lativittatus]|nr:hypothetical protein HMI56_004781 [Coelomomyces lativittatus]KAJ1513506.1 hypothetical protein HMI54_014959 [Coelomomyces lativittatus]